MAPGKATSSRIGRIYTQQVSWPVSVQICTLNEAANIVDCLAAVQANDPDDVLVIDGGSTDGTPDLVRDAGARLLEAGPIGLARQRRLGYLDSPCPYTAFVDADDRLGADWLGTMLTELQAGGYSALQGCLRAAEPTSWWEHGWNEYLAASIRPVPDTIMVGRPALFRTDSLLGISSTEGILVEDTEMSKDFQDRGLRQGIGTAVSYRRCPSTMTENLSKWRGYGRGYREFARKHPDRQGALIKHMLFTVPVARSWPPVLRGKPTQPVFGLLMGTSMAIGWARSSL